MAATRRTPGDLDSQIQEILEQVTDKPDVWDQLVAYSPNLSIGLFLVKTNEEIGISATAIRALAARGIALYFDIYGPTDEDRAKENELTGLR